MIAAMKKKMQIIIAKTKLLHREKGERKRFHYTGRELQDCYIFTSF